MAPQRILLPMLATACGIATFSVMDALMKRAAIGFGAYDAVLWRNLVGSLLGLPLWLASGWRRAGSGQAGSGQGLTRGFRPDARRLRVHLARSAVVAAMSVLFFYGLVRMPMAEGMALSFIAPLIALYLAALFLREPVTGRALAASVMGLVGVAVIALARGHASGGVHSDAMLGIAAILASAVLYAGNLVLQRHQAQLAAPAEIAFFQSLFVFLLVLPLAPWLAILPRPHELAAVTGAAALALVSLMLLSWGYARAEAHRLLPIEYSGFAWAALMGWWWFGEPVGMATLAGVVLIVAGCWIGTTSPPPEQTAL